MTNCRAGATGFEILQSVFEAAELVPVIRAIGSGTTPDNGPLCVLPGTHALGRLSEVQISELARDMLPVYCVVNAGGVIAMRPLMVHASSKSRIPSPRRVLHIEYAALAGISPDIELAVA